jgi:DNA adenine methylase
MVQSQLLNCPVVIPYYGGKFELSRRLVPMLPPHNRYIEVFAGGLSMFFRKKKVKDNIVNDIDNDIVNLYISVLEDFDSFIKYIKLLPRSRYLFDQYKSKIHKAKEIKIPDYKRAAMYYYVIRNAFNKNPYNILSIGGNSNWKNKLLEEIVLSKSKLDGVLIENMDFRKLIEKHHPTKGDLWYLDPPYVIASERKDYYMHTFTMPDHIKVKEICDDIDKAGAEFMVSYDDRDEIKDMFKDYNIKELKTIYASSSNKKSRNELVIMNYVPNGCQEVLF